MVKLLQAGPSGQELIQRIYTTRAICPQRPITINNMPGIYTAFTLLLASASVQGQAGGPDIPPPDILHLYRSTLGPKGTLDTER